MQDSCLGKCFTILGWETHGLSHIYIYLFIKSGSCFSLRNLIQIDSSLICTMLNTGKCNFVYINVCTHYQFIHCIFCSDFCFIWFLYTFNITNLWPMLIIYAYIDIHVYNRTYKPSTRCHGKVVLQ